MNRPQFTAKGSCIFGVNVTHDSDKNTCIEVFIEDDGLWSRNMDFSAYHLNELIDVLTKAQAHIERYGQKKPKYAHKLATKRVVQSVQKIFEGQDDV